MKLRNLFSRTPPTSTPPATASTFAKPGPDMTVTDGTAPGVAVALVDEVAVDNLVKYLTRLPDLDEVLRQAGVTRHRLAVLMYDDEIAQAFETRGDAMLATPMKLEPSEGAGADLIREVLEPVKQAALEGIFKARQFGYSVLEAVWFVREDGKIGLQYLGEKPMEWFEPKPDGRLMYYPDDGTGGTTGIEVDQRYKFFMTRVKPTYRNPLGEALLSRLYWPWFFRQNGWKFWAKFLERFGTPMVVGKSSDPAAMVQALQLAHSQAVIGVGPDDTVETIGVQAGNAGQAFEAFENANLRRIQKVVLGQTMTSGTDGGAGTRALGDVHNDVRLDKRNSDVVLATTTMQRIVDAICELNGIARHLVMFADDQGLEPERAERDNKLYTMGVRFEADYIAENYDLNVEDFTLTSETVPDPLSSEPGPGVPANPGQTGDANAGAKGVKEVKAGKVPPHLFTKHAKGTKFTKAQTIVESVAEGALDEAVSPMSTELVRTAIAAATGPDDLTDRLFALLGDDVGEPEFQDILERALYCADVLGYAHAGGKV